jgi:hypothetical protein
VLLAHASDQELMLSPGKLDGLVWHSKLFDFPGLGFPYPASGRHVHNGHLLCNSLYGQNPEQVLTIPDGNASMVVPMAHTTPPKEDKVDTSSVEVPTGQALVARPGSKAPDDNPIDDDPSLLNFVVAESEIVCWTSSQL